MKKKLSIILTEHCNLSCYYCNFPEITNPCHGDFDLYFKYIEVVNRFCDKVSMINLVGGEPGLIQGDLLLKAIKAIHPKIQKRICTNGLLFDLKNFDEIYENIDMIKYHVTDLNNFVNCSKYKKIAYLYVCDKNTEPENIKKILNNGINDIILAPMDLKTIESKDAIIITERTNIASELLKSGKIKCYFGEMQIDIANGTIIHCCNSSKYSPKVELNDANLIDFLNNKKHTEYFISCSYCNVLDENYLEVLLGDSAKQK